MHVQSVQNYCFSSSNMQICDVLLTVVVVLATLTTTPQINDLIR